MSKGNNDFTVLNDEIRDCRECRLWKSRINSLPGEGCTSAELMLIAQAPGREENKKGKMFVGPSGDKLNELLLRAGISREEIFMTNLVKCMLPDYRKPRKDEIEACSNYLDREIDLVKPSVVSTLGYFSTRYIFEKHDIRGKLDFPEVCGEVFSIEGVRIVPLGHPAAVLYDDSIWDEMVEDYKELGKLEISKN